MMKQKKRKIWIAVVGIIILLIVIVVLAYAHVRTTYSQMEVQKQYLSVASEKGSYIYFAQGILKYSRDGLAFYDMEGEEQWNHPCQMQTPMVVINETSAVVGDRGGSSVIVITGEGIKGEFETSRPIERLTVSAQGIVGAVLQAETTPQICCYDANGKILVEQKASLSNTGYPLDISLSADGKTMLVSYLVARENSVSTEIVYYNFDEDIDETEVARKTYADSMIAEVDFLTNSTSLLIGEDMLSVWDGTAQPKEVVSIPIEKEIKSIAYQKEKIAVVLKNKSSVDCELRVYNTNGKKLFSESLEDDYANVKVENNQVILFGENKCLLYNMYGVKRYEGSLDSAIQEIVPVAGWNTYMLIGSEGMKKAHLIK